MSVPEIKTVAAMNLCPASWATADVLPPIGLEPMHKKNPRPAHRARYPMSSSPRSLARLAVCGFKAKEAWRFAPGRCMFSCQLWCQRSSRPGDRRCSAD